MLVAITRTLVFKREIDRGGLDIMKFCVDSKYRYLSLRNGRLVYTNYRGQLRREEVSV